jgi:hypothetical protein
MNTSYTSHGLTMDYEPTDRVHTLAWFNIAKCARERMGEHVADIHRWRGERAAFYTALNKMGIPSKVYMPDA